MLAEYSYIMWRIWNGGITINSYVNNSNNIHNGDNNKNSDSSGSHRRETSSGSLSKLSQNITCKYI